MGLRIEGADGAVAVIRGAIWMLLLSVFCQHFEDENRRPPAAYWGGG